MHLSIKLPSGRWLGLLAPTARLGLANSAVAIHLPPPVVSGYLLISLYVPSPLALSVDL